MDRHRGRPQTWLSGRREIILAVTLSDRRAADALAAAALARVVRDRCPASSWRGLARGVAWQLVCDGEASAQTIDFLAETAEAILAESIDEALWAVECAVAEAYKQSLRVRPGDQVHALVAARMEAREVSVRRLDAVVERVAAALRAGVRENNRRKGEPSASSRIEATARAPSPRVGRAERAVLVRRYRAVTDAVARPRS